MSASRKWRGACQTLDEESRQLIAVRKGNIFRSEFNHMPAGRRRKDTTDVLVSLVEHEFLCQALCLNAEELSKWLLHIPVGLMNGRDVQRFHNHRSMLSLKRAKELDEAVPGINRLTMLPWRVLAWGNYGTPKLWRVAENRLKESSRLPFNSEKVNTRRIDKRFRPVGCAKDWMGVHDFFQAMIEFRRSVLELPLARHMHLDRPATLVVQCLAAACEHPVLARFQGYMLYLVQWAFVMQGYDLLSRSGLLQLAASRNASLAISTARNSLIAAGGLSKASM